MVKNHQKFGRPTIRGEVSYGGYSVYYFFPHLAKGALQIPMDLPLLNSYLLGILIRFLSFP